MIRLCVFLLINLLRLFRSVYNQWRCKSEFFHKRHRIFTKNQHSPLDSANNTCYSTTRTKEEGNKERQRKMKKSFPSGSTQVPKKETGKQQLRF